MLLGFTLIEKFAIAYLSSVCPCRKKHKKKVNDSESWLRQEESEKNLRSPETPLLNTRQLRSIELIGIFFIETIIHILKYANYSLHQFFLPFC